jgi:hypothetical protein
MSDGVIDAAVRSAEEQQRYRRWYMAALAYLGIKGVNPGGPGIHLEADELAHAFVSVANEEQAALREEIDRLRKQLAGNEPSGSG